jgi:hypothetical protein
MKHIQNCGTNFHVLELVEASMDYESPTRGMPLKIKRKIFNPSAQINDGWIVTDFTIHNEITVRKNVTLCETAPCPIERGDNEYSSGGIFPEHIKGNFTVHQEWFTTNGQPLLCLHVEFDVGRDGYLNMDNYTYANYTEQDAELVMDIFMPHFPVIITHLQLITDYFTIYGRHPSPSVTPSPQPQNIITASAMEPEVEGLTEDEAAGVGFGVSATVFCCFVWLFAVLRRHWNHPPKRVKNKETFVYVNPIYAEDWK